MPTNIGKIEKWLHRDRLMFEQTWKSFKRT